LTSICIILTAQDKHLANTGNSMCIN